MTYQDIIDHFGGRVAVVAKVFRVTPRVIYQWRAKGVPEKISLRADYITDGVLPHDPSQFGHDYKRGQYKQAVDSPAKTKQVS